MPGAAKTRDDHARHRRARRVLSKWDLAAWAAGKKEPALERGML